MTTFRHMSSLFRQQWWKLWNVGISIWFDNRHAIDDRNDFCTNYPSKCKDEAWFKREITEQLQEKFHLKKKWREEKDMGDLKCGIERVMRVIV